MFRWKNRFFTGYFFFFLSTFLFCHFSLASQGAESTEASETLEPTQAIEPRNPLVLLEPPGSNRTRLKLIPLPIYATLPNEGSTFGLMPVLLQIQLQTQRTESIFAPSVSWNHVIKTTGTFRWFYYPKLNQTLMVTASASTHINYGTYISWQNLPFEPHEWTDEIMVRVQRSIFFRFFGIGSDSLNENETSHTRLRGSFSYRKGINFPRYWNVGVILEGMRDLVQPDAVPGLPLSSSVFPNTPGMGSGATVLGQSINIRFDSRDLRDYSKDGWYGDFVAGIMEGMGNIPTYFRSQFQLKTLISETDRLQTGARFLWRWVGSPLVPFYYQSSLGGSYLLRGFTEDRFIDQGAWTLEFEQRFVLFRTHIYGVTTDWRVDPFLAVGQVYHNSDSIFSRVNLTGGVGFRAWVQPNVVGRVDIAMAGNGPQFYVDIGYPF